MRNDQLYKITLMLVGICTVLLLVPAGVFIFLVKKFMLPSDRTKQIG